MLEGTSQPPTEEGDADTLRKQVDAGRSRDIGIDVFLNKVIDGYVQDEWNGKAENMAKLTRVKEFLFKQYALSLPDFGGVRQAAMCWS